MGFTDSIQHSFKKFADFSGRASKQEWMYFFLLYLAVGLVVSIITRISDGAGAFVSLLSLVLLVPMLAVSWRRFHDQGRSGLRTLIWLVPLVGWIIYIIWSIAPGEPGPNAHGPNPEGPGAGQSYGPQDSHGEGYGPQGGYAQPGPQAGYGQPGANQA